MATHFLDRFNASALGLMAAVTIILSHKAFTDYLTPVISLGALLEVFRTKVNPSWWILAGGLKGVIRFIIM